MMLWWLWRWTGGVEGVTVIKKAVRWGQRHRAAGVGGFGVCLVGGHGRGGDDAVPVAVDVDVFTLINR